MENWRRFWRRIFSLYYFSTSNILYFYFLKIQIIQGTCMLFTLYYFYSMTLYTEAANGGVLRNNCPYLPSAKLLTTFYGFLVLS